MNRTCFAMDASRRKTNPGEEPWCRSTGGSKKGKGDCLVRFLAPLAAQANPGLKLKLKEDMLLNFQN